MQREVVAVEESLAAVNLGHLWWRQLLTREQGVPNIPKVSKFSLKSLPGENDGNLGLLGRVFRQRLPEWIADVEYYNCKEYPRLNDALHYNQTNFGPEVDKVCKALEICNGVRQNALVEIFQILTMVCETHKLALTQTWVPCKHRRVLADGGGGVKKSCRSFDGSWEPVSKLVASQVSRSRGDHTDMMFGKTSKVDSPPMSSMSTGRNSTEKGTGKNVSDAHVRGYLFGLIYPRPCLESRAGLRSITLIREKRTIMIGSTRPDHDIGDHYGRSRILYWVERKMEGLSPAGVSWCDVDRSESGDSPRFNKEAIEEEPKQGESYLTSSTVEESFLVVFPFPTKQRIDIACPCLQRSRTIARHILDNSFLPKPFYPHS
ncbi:hypothetical protein IFM89_038055 [Coptis chinensis]|uniref:NLP1-9 GAF domain-containing protein n=1 Tax=Coptis chinensis TaxID=261450 RepID=A0A835H8H0_9MAGN|nr:hypothetical protein IFM89_038055 [Coptis chinensis]